MKAAQCLRFLLVATALVSRPSTHADEPILEQRSGAATLRISAVLEKKVIQLPFTDVLKAVIVVNGDIGLEVEPPEKWTRGPWQVRPEGRPVQSEADGKSRWSQVLLIEPLQPGDLSLALEPLRYRGSDGAWQTAGWQPIAVRVTHRLTQPDLKNARDITAIEELPAKLPPEQRSYRFIVVVVGAVCLVGLLAFWLRRRQTSRRRGTAEAWALYELQRLQALSLPEQGKHERFGTLLAGLVRQYLEKRYELPARRRTTAEFLALLGEHPDLAPQHGFLETFLRRCDLLKFAPVASSVEECRTLAEQVSQFLSQQQPPRLVPAPLSPLGRGAKDH